MRIRKTFQGEIPENKIVNMKSNSQTDAYSCDFANNTFATKWTTLWTNLNPANAFSSQSITLSSSDYDILIVICALTSYDGSAYGRKYITGTLKGSNITLDVGGNYSGSIAVFERTMSRTNDTKYSVDNCTVRTSNSSFQDNSFAIPIKIFGVKL